MPFCRIVRDNRGYEYLSLIHQNTGRRGKVRQQLLYWFRTPPNIKVGRQALDEEVMRALEAQNPGVQFDWDALRDTPPLLPPVEPWRERRRAERVARQLRDAEEETEPPAANAQPVAIEPLEPVEPLVGDAPVGAFGVDAVPAASLAEVVVLAPVSGSPADPLPGSVRRHRHRRRGRRGSSDGRREAAGAAPAPAEAPASTSTGDGPSGPFDDES